LLLDGLSGALVGAQSGSLVGVDPDIGGYLQLIDPSAFGELTVFKKQTDQLVKDIKANPTAPDSNNVRVPGYRSQELRREHLDRGDVDVQDAVWQAFVALHQKLTQ
jgi:LDH2 family malate/lactate/ureidoglycolate dehydrogenase